MVESFRRITTSDYGGPDVDRREDRVHTVTVADDRRSVHLAVDELRPGFVYEFHLKNLGARGERFHPSEAYYTFASCLERSDQRLPRPHRRCWRVAARCTDATCQKLVCSRESAALFVRRTAANCFLRSSSPWINQHSIAFRSWSRLGPAICRSCHSVRGSHVLGLMLYGPVAGPTFDSNIIWFTAC